MLDIRRLETSDLLEASSKLGSGPGHLRRTLFNQRGFLGFFRSRISFIGSVYVNFLSLESVVDFGCLGIFSGILGRASPVGAPRFFPKFSNFLVKILRAISLGCIGSSLNKF